MSLTCSNYIVYHQNLLSLLDGIGLDLKEIGTILLLETRLLGWPRQLSTLSNRSKTGTQGHSKAGTEEEASGVESDNHIGFDTFEGIDDLKFESANERGV